MFMLWYNFDIPKYEVIAMNSILRKLSLILVASTAIFAVSASLAGAAIPTSIESTITVIGVNKSEFTVPTGTTRAQLIATLRAHYGSHTPKMDNCTFRIADKNIKLTAAEMQSITPARINYDHKADVILTASLKPKQKINVNEAILKGINSTAVNRIIDKYHIQTAVPVGPASYVYNPKTKRIEVKAARKGTVAPKADMRKAIHDSMIQFATQGYRGSLTTSTVKKINVEPNAKNLGKIILVVRSERKLYLYNNGKLVSTYRVAVGRKGNSTPAGNYKIGLKRKNPTWSNPGSSWGKRMPKSIGPGPNNPLGVRAMNLDRANGKTTLLRIHGTSNTASIGQAASAGCVRMTNKDVVKLFNDTPKGTRVWIR